MEYSFNNLPEKVVVRGVFSQNGSLIMSKESEHGLRLGNLKLLIQKHGKKPVIGTGAIVTSDIHEKTVAAGVPAKVVRSDVTWTIFPVNLDIMSKNYVELSRI